MDKRVVFEVRQASQRMWSLEEARAADRRQVLFHQQVGMEAGPLSATHADGDVYILGDEIDESLRGQQPDIDIRMGAPEAEKPRHQPFGGKAVQRADGQGAGRS